MERRKNTRDTFKDKIKRLFFLNQNLPPKLPPKEKKRIEIGGKMGFVKRSPRKEFLPPEDFSSVFISGGIGDVLAVDSFLSLEDKANIENFLYGTRKSEFLIELFSVPIVDYPKLKNHEIVWHNFTNFWCFYHKMDCVRRIRANGGEPSPSLLGAKDLGITNCFADIARGKCTFSGSSLLKQKIATVERFSLPANFYVICPFSTDKSNRRRDFSGNDWTITLRMLAKRKMKGVVINYGEDLVPQHELLVDLNNKTTMPESVEILKSACGYIGIDSSLSVLAAQLFNSPNLQVKCVNPHGLNNKAIYWAPHTEFHFIKDQITYE